MKKYLIIGGNGFIGSHLSKALLHQGNNVVVVDNAGRTATGVKSYIFDIENTKKLTVVFEEEAPDFVYYLAGPINLRRSIKDPLFSNDVNFLSRIQGVLEICAKHKVEKFIFISSGGALYENAAKLPTNEEYFCHPTSLYGLANLAIEKYVTAYCESNGPDFSIARLGNVYGPGQWVSGFIPATILNMAKKQQSVIMGTGKQTRDFIYINDAVEALLLLAEKSKNGIYNIGSGEEMSLNAIFSMLQEMMALKIEPAYKEAGMSGTERSVLDIAKIKKELAWSPKTDIKEGLLKTIEYYATSR